MDIQIFITPPRKWGANVAVFDKQVRKESSKNQYIYMFFFLLIRLTMINYFSKNLLKLNKKEK